MTKYKFTYRMWEGVAGWMWRLEAPCSVLNGPFPTGEAALRSMLAASPGSQLGANRPAEEEECDRS